MTEDELSPDEGPRSDLGRFAPYHPPRHNDAVWPIIDPLPPAETIERIRNGFDAERLRQVADGLGSDVASVSVLIGAPDPLVSRLAELVGRWRADDGFMERLAVWANSSARADEGREPTDRSAAVRDDADRDIDTRVLAPLISAALAVDAGAERVTGAAADRLYELERLVETSRAVFDSDDIAREWFGAALPVLRGGRPHDLLDTTIGRERVDELLHAIEYGFAA